MNQNYDERMDIAKEKKFTFPWWMIVLFLILSVGAYFRVSGIDWGAEYHMHPDERFMTMVETAISPVQSINEYFNTGVSSLNPNNRGYTFYVYGTLPLFLVRYVAEIASESGYGEIFLIGRYLSAIFDLLTIAIIFLIADRLFRKMAINLLAAAFYAAAVLPIQLSHYFIVDSTANFFTVLTIYFAVRIMTAALPWEGKGSSILENDLLKHNWQGIWGYVLFGLAFGMSLASKVSTFLVVILLPIAVLVQINQSHNGLSKNQILLILRNLAIAAVISFVTFRICQPYAFNGPDFFGIRINENWINNLKDLAAQSTGNSDAPPALQWARRPITFSWENMVNWGLGLPLGLLAWIGFLWMGWCMLKQNWRPYLVIWFWTGSYFVYQSVQFSCTMRYQVNIYPTLAIIAAWFLYTLWGYIGKIKNDWLQRTTKIVYGIISVGIVAGTFAWAYAFTQIYIDPFTREAASEWIYDNIPTAINLSIENEDETFIAHVPYGLGEQIDSQNPLQIVFTPQYDAPVFSIQVDHVLAIPTSEVQHTLRFEVRENIPDSEVVLSGLVQNEFAASNDPRGSRYGIPVENMAALSPEKEYLLTLQPAEPEMSLQIMGAVSIGYTIGDGVDYQFLPEIVNTLDAGEEYRKIFKPAVSGQVNEIVFPHVLDFNAVKEQKTLAVQLVDQDDGGKIIFEKNITSSFLAETDSRGEEFRITIDDSVLLNKDHNYEFVLRNASESGRIGIFGTKKADESSWDDVIPLSMYQYNPFDYYDGLYRTDLNFEMYWDDNESKRERFYEILDQTDYIFITSNRQWGTTVRVPERYPLTVELYRSLIGCPEDQDILYCYRVAQPDTYQGKLGFELVEVFQSDPHIGDLVSFNTQFAEEAFTVYDHPKVLIFKKTSDYQSATVREIFNAVDLSKVVHLTPKEVGSYNPDRVEKSLTLMLPEETWQAQQEGGTWAELFDPDLLYNRYPALAVLVWYLGILLISWIVYPFVHLAFPNLRFSGYPFAKLIGLMLLAFGSWWLSSNGLSYSKDTIGTVLDFLILINIIIFILRRKTMLEDLRQNWKSFLMIEGITLAFFLFFLFVRIGNPDLWHPAKGGEKPMDFSYFNAVLKSESFPPYDPWFAGGYINYYYYGFVIVGTLVKLLGINPSVAYNLILPSFYSMGAIGAFTVGWNLTENVQLNTQRGSIWNFLTGMFAALMTMVIGNLGTLRMIWHGFIRLAGGTLPLDGINIWQKLVWTVSGFAKFVGGESLGYGYGNWYWDPSRAFPGEAITEFPMFTYLYADLHAHLISIPITILALGIALNLFLSVTKREFRWAEMIAVSLLGGVVVGAFRPTNTWDLPLYIILISLAYLFSGVIHPLLQRGLHQIPLKISIFYKTGVGYLLFLFGTIMFYEPFTRWYGASYTKFNPFTGVTTPFWSYITHWGFFLFLYISWLIWESRDWMANTPASSILKLKRYRSLLAVLGILWLAALAWLFIKQIAIGWFVISLIIWAGLLIIRREMPIQKKAVLFLYSTALFITLFVELMALDGDLGRMNTVFKFYLQAWTLIAICSAVVLVWLLPAFHTVWRDWKKEVWFGMFWVLTLSVCMFTIFATTGKIRDRMNDNAPTSLDGMAYMQVATHSDGGLTMDLSEDYEAIRWMQRNVSGTPVIVEAHTSEYRWGSRFTIYTGLPGVLGWNWHQRQQRAILANSDVQDREDEINQFYESSDIDQVLAFLKKYQVKYIINGQLESAIYSATGLAKFPLYDGKYWDVVYQSDHTIIYKVRE
jgi:YYY domain-containing protein